MTMLTGASLRDSSLTCPAESQHIWKGSLLASLSYCKICCFFFFGLLYLKSEIESKMYYFFSWYRSSQISFSLLILIYV